MEVKDMDDRQRQQIRELREEGYGYGRIAQILEISENTIKTYCRRHGLGGVATNLASSEGKRQYCPCCKSVLELIPGRKPKKFCSDKCRMKWWNSHLDQVKRKANYSFVCPVCKKQFSVYGNANRKYCSHACYIKARFEGDEV